MRVAFVGDVHGCIYHCIAALLRLRERAPLDAIIQVGDLGAWPDKQTEVAADPSSVWDADDNPAQDDWYDCLREDAPLASSLRRARELLGVPILFIRGNHDDAHWLRAFEVPGGDACIDPFGLFRYVADATVLELGGLRLALLGGVRVPSSLPTHLERSLGMHRFDPAALARLRREAAGSVDVLVTHDGPHGIARSWRGQLQGAPVLSDLEQALRPRWHIAGHYHTPIGPEPRGAGTYLGLSCLIHPGKAKWGRSDEVFDPSGRVHPASIAVLDTQRDRLEVVDDAVVESIDRTLDFASFVDQLVHDQGA